MPGTILMVPYATGCVALKRHGLKVATSIATPWLFTAREVRACSIAMFRLPQTVAGATRLLVLEGHASISSRARWARSTTDLGKGLVEHLQAAATRAVSRTMRGIHAAGRHHRVSGCSYDQRSRNAQLYFGCWGIAVRSRKFAAFWTQPHWHLTRCRIVPDRSRWTSFILSSWPSPQPSGTLVPSPQASTQGQRNP